jgi:hypothetical protein
MDNPGLTAATLAGAHASAARRRIEACVSALGIEERPAALTLIGEASQLVLALHLAFAAVVRYSAKTGEPGPFIRDGAMIAERVKHMRDTVMHWEGKVDRHRDSGLWIETRGVVVDAPKGKHGLDPEMAGITWTQARRAADAIYVWSLLVIEPPDSDS